MPLHMLAIKQNQASFEALFYQKIKETDILKQQVICTVNDV